MSEFLTAAERQKARHPEGQRASWQLLLSKKSMSHPSEDRQLISRADAKRLGLSRYFTGQACKFGHVCERRVCNGHCLDCTPRWWRKPPASIIDVPLVGPPKPRKSRTGLAPEALKARQMEDSRRRSQKWASENPDRNRDKHRSWRSENREKRREAERRRQARKRGIATEVVTQAQILMLGESQRWLCVACRSGIQKDFHIDHIQPLAGGGMHCLANLQLLCPPCNRKKHTKDPIDFMQSKGYLI